MKQQEKNVKRLYSIDPYNPEWVIKFNSIKSILERIFKEKALAIEHIGSTSIPGMRAKPLIDVLVIVEKIESFEEEKRKMEELGYEWGENYIEPNSLIFFKEGDDRRKTENIHICEKNSPKAIQFIQTRDYVRAHPERALAYSNLKEKLNAEYPDDYPAYRAGKQSFLDESEHLAYEWIKSRE